jgi:hypothetical protein
MSDDETRRQTSEDDDEAKLQRLIDEGVFDPELPEEYADVIRGLTPDEVEVISSINKRLLLVQEKVPGVEAFGPVTKF